MLPEPVELARGMIATTVLVAASAKWTRPLEVLPKTGVKSSCPAARLTWTSQRGSIAFTRIVPVEGSKTPVTFTFLFTSTRALRLVVELIAGLREWIGKNKSITGLRDDPCKRLLFGVLIGILVGGLYNRLLPAMRRLGRTGRILRIRQLVGEEYG